MPTARCDEETFIRLFQTKGAALTAAELGIRERKVYERRRAIEGRLNMELKPPMTKARSVNVPDHPQRQKFNLTNGCVLVGSDFHFWPNYVSTAWRAFVMACKEFQPRIIILNGDVVDGASISRHPRIGWDHTPKFKDELEFAKSQCDEVERAAPNAERVWNLGNHDARFETRLANVVPEVEGIHGTSLQDHFPSWRPAWSTWINDDRRGPVIKHKFKGGMHSGHNNTLYAGRTMICGHDHQLKVTTFRDYDGIRWGVHGGFMGVPYWPQFVDYTEDAPVMWTSGFVKLNFHDGELLWPEVIRVVNEDEGLVEYSGKVYSV